MFAAAGANMFCECEKNILEIVYSTLCQLVSLLYVRSTSDGNVACVCSMFGKRIGCAHFNTHAETMCAHFLSVKASHDYRRLCLWC